MNKLAAIVVIIVIVAGGIFFVLQVQPQTTLPTTIPPVATGTPPTASGTTTPQPLPAPSAKGVVRGQVLLGPTCPVERVPPDPACAPKPYQTTIRIQPVNPSAAYMTISSDASGMFTTSLDLGSYTLQAQSANNSYYPHCSPVQVSVSAGQSQNVTINCDTGIR